MDANCDFDCFHCKFPDCRNSKVDGVTLAREKKLHDYRDPAAGGRRSSGSGACDGASCGMRRPPGTARRASPSGSGGS
ncbi:MAG: hypothetical protein LUG47_05420 [Clostridiales bacterium]|nr:hypothetical protein [Clostridiales bacterium]